MNQTHHALRDCHRDAGGNQGPTSRRQFDVLGAVEIHPRVPLVGAGGQGKVAVETNYRETGRHERKDYP